MAILCYKILTDVKMNILPIEEVDTAFTKIIRFKSTI